jgi:3-oxoacyl-[acyl-carrier protein] reductase
MSNTKSLQDRITIITGGAQGIGKTAALKFAEEGATVIIWDINTDKGQESQNELTSLGYIISFEKVDTTKLIETEEAAKKVYEKFGKIDILVNNAGITRDAGQLNMTMEQWQQVIDVNLTGVFNCTKAVAPYMVKNSYGRIINTSSLVGMYGNLGQSNYAATKSGVVGITKVWARELSKHGITVNAVIPGFIETESLKLVPENVVKSIEEKIPVGRLGKPEDIAAGYLFLASSQASYISGSVLSIDGGYVA